MIRFVLNFDTHVHPLHRPTWRKTITNPRWSQEEIGGLSVEQHKCSVHAPHRQKGTRRFSLDNVRAHDGDKTIGVAQQNRTGGL